MRKKVVDFEIRFEAANELKRQAFKQGVKKFNLVNDQRVYNIGFWSGYVEALKDIGGSG